MPVKKYKKKKPEAEEKHTFLFHLPKILAGLLATGAIGGTTLSYNKGSHADERTAVAESKILRLEADAGQTNRKVERIDRRTIRMEMQIQQIADKVGAKKIPKPTGPVEE